MPKADGPIARLAVARNIPVANNEFSFEIQQLGNDECTNSLFMYRTVGPAGRALIFTMHSSCIRCNSSGLSKYYMWLQYNFSRMHIFCLLYIYSTLEQHADFFIVEEISK